MKQDQEYIKAQALARRHRKNSNLKLWIGTLVIPIAIYLISAGLVLFGIVKLVKWIWNM